MNKGPGSHSEAEGSYKKYIGDVIRSGAAGIAVPLRNLILLPILAKSLGAGAYGTWSQIEVTISLLMPLALLQLGFAMTRFLAAETDKAKINRGFFSILAAVSLTSALLSILMFILARPFAMVLLGGADAQPLVELAASLIFLTTLDQVIVEYFVAFRQMGKFSIFSVTKTVGELALVGYLVATGFGLYGAITALLIIRVSLFIIGFLFVKRQTQFAIPSLAIMKPYLAFSLPLLPYSLCQWMINLGDRYVIGYFLGAASVGLYAAPYSLALSISLFWFPFSISLFPAMTQLYQNNKIQEIRTHLKYSLKFFLAFAIPAIFGLSVLSRSLLTTLATSEFIEGYLIVPIIGLATALFCSSYPFSHILMLFKETRIVALIFGGSALLNLAVNIILVPQIGILGAAISTLLTFMIHLIVLSVISNRRLPFDIDVRFIIKSILSSAIMGSVIWNLNLTGVIGILIAIAAGAAIYFGMIILLKGFTKNEYSFLKSALRSVTKAR